MILTCNFSAITSQDDEIDKLDHVVKDIKAEMASVQKDNRSLENQVAEQTSENEHLRRELHDSKTQYKAAAQEVCDFFIIFYLVLIRC